MIFISKILTTLSCYIKYVKGINLKNINNGIAYERIDIFANMHNEHDWILCMRMKKKNNQCLHLISINL